MWTMKRPPRFLIVTSLTWGLMDYCDGSATFREPDATELSEPSRQIAVARPTSVHEAMWDRLRDRYQAAITAHGRARVESVLLDARCVGSATLARDATAVARFMDAAARARSAAKARPLPTLADAIALNARVTGQTGALRTEGLQASRGSSRQLRYTSGGRVDAELRALFAELEASRASTPARAAEFDQRLISIHPFLDGNGRTARLLTDWVLARDGYPPIVQTRTADRPVGSILSPAAHLDRLTDGMRASVALVEALA